MPIPEFDQDGLLPAGIHDCSLAELVSRFGVFRGSERRPLLLAKLEEFLSEARAVDVLVELLIDGSFATAKPDPNDVDLILVVDADHDFVADLNPRVYNLLSKRRVQRRYGFDLLVARKDSAEYTRWVKFFSRVRLEPEQQKGILRLRL